MPAKDRQRVEERDREGVRERERDEGKEALTLKAAAANVS